MSLSAGFCCSWDDFISVCSKCLFVCVCVCVEIDEEQLLVIDRKMLVVDAKQWSFFGIPQSFEGVCCLALRASSGKRARLSGFVLPAVTPFRCIRCIRFICPRICPTLDNGTFQPLEKSSEMGCLHRVGRIP